MTILIFLSAILQALYLKKLTQTLHLTLQSSLVLFRLQELLSYWDPQIAGVMIPLVLGVVLWMAFPTLIEIQKLIHLKENLQLCFIPFSSRCWSLDYHWRAFQRTRMELDLSMD